MAIVAVLGVLCALVYAAAVIGILRAEEGAGDLKNIFTWVSIASGVAGLALVLPRRTFMDYVSTASTAERLGLFVAVLGLAAGLAALLN